MARKRNHAPPPAQGLAAEPSVPKAKVLIVDDHPIFREGLRRVIDAEADLEVLAEAASAAQALAAATAQRPDLAIVDLTLEQSSGLDLIKDLAVRWTGLPVLVLSNHDETLYAERCVRAGARGYVMKDRPPAELIAAVHDVLAGKFHLGHGITHRILSKLGSPTSPAAGDLSEELSDRELQVFELYGRGRSTRQIADALHLSGKTIESHRDHIKQKLGFPDSTTLVHAAVHWLDTHREL
jgi:DNA-binding NarL/FixJ family response regulator